jgi:tRNA A-37 threonylcarbamoyl transferase component Bud32
VPTATLLRAGDVIGGFRIEDVIGIGGMAIVYRAEQVSLGRAVALKVLSSKLTSDEIFRERFRREGTHAAALEHPNIVPVYDCGEQDGLLYLAMRLVEGTNLAEMIETRGLTADQTIEILRPIASALDTAHAAGLIHRDVKPQNILIATHGHPYLADFGVAKGSNTYGLTATGGFVGSVNYASPEQIKGLTLTPASDVYALTAVLYQCLTGQVAYPRETDAGVMHAHLHEPPPTLPTIAGANGEFHSVLARGMAKDPGSRYGHAGDLINAAGLSVSRLPSKMRNAVPAFPAENVDVGAGDKSEPRAVAGADHDEIRGGASLTVADQRRSPAPEPEPERSTSGRRWPLLAGSAGVALAVAVTIVLFAGGSGGAHASAFRSGNLLLPAGQGWHRSVSSLSGLSLTDPISISKSGVQLYAGTVRTPTRIAAALPPSLLPAYGKPSKADVVALPLGPSKRYSWSRGRVSSLSVTIVSTDAGEVAIACDTSSASAIVSMPVTCADVTRKAEILGTRVDYPGPDPRVAAQLARILSPRIEFAAATPAELSSNHLTARAGALTRLAALDATAAVALSRISVPARYRAPVATLGHTLSREGALARELASAARDSRRASYATTRSRFAHVSVDLLAAVHGISSVGFTLRRARSIGIPGLPPNGPRPAPVTPAPLRPPSPSPSPSTPSPTPTTPVYTPAPFKPAPKRNPQPPEGGVNAPN